MSLLSLTKGLSPPERGNLDRQRAVDVDRGPIPARAGEPAKTGQPAITARAYPRPSGGTRISSARSMGSRGLSPPERGNLALDDDVYPIPGPIPARAGEPFFVLG